MSDKKDQKKDRDDGDRISPQDVFDQGEAVQVGGTVVNPPLNLEEDGHQTNRSDGDDDADHNYNDLEDRDVEEESNLDAGTVRSTKDDKADRKDRKLP